MVRSGLGGAVDGTRTDASQVWPTGSLHPLLERLSAPLAERLIVTDAAIAAITVVIGWALRFTQDDAYITLRFSRNLAEGTGLVFNAGERVEGYTNFLWTWFLALPHHFGGDPVLWSDIASIAAGVVTALVTLRLARDTLGDRRLALVAVGLLVSFHSFAIYLTGGLETQWQTALVTLVVWLLSPIANGSASPMHLGSARLVAASLAAGLACLTRLDSIVILVAILAAATWTARRNGELAARPFAMLLLPAAALVVPWVIWKVGYYDAILPNTFRAKQTPILWALVRGAMFGAIFLAVTLLFVAIPIIRPGWRLARRRPTVRPLLLVAGAWVAYLLYVGADFMEFRFLVPILPIAAVLTTGAVAHLPHRRQLAAVAVLLIGSAAKWVFFPGLLGIESARGLKGHVTAEGGWLEMGEVLRDAWPQGEHGGPTIAATPAGAIPYASRLRTIDMLGLTDVDANDEANRWELTKLKAGHEHIATVDYLESRHVDLIVGLERDCGELAEGDPIEVVRELYLTYRVERDDLPDGARLVEIPLRTAKRCMVVVQISKRPVVNRVVDARGWATRDI